MFKILEPKTLSLFVKGAVGGGLLGLSYRCFINSKIKKDEERLRDWEWDEYVRRSGDEYVRRSGDEMLKLYIKMGREIGRKN